MINDDLKHFTVTSDKIYDRHKYKVTFKNGKSVTFDDYDTMKYMWYRWQDDVEKVDVIDEGGKGF